MRQKHEAERAREVDPIAHPHRRSTASIVVIVQRRFSGVQGSMHPNEGMLSFPSSTNQGLEHNYEEEEGSDVDRELRPIARRTGKHIAAGEERPRINSGQQTTPIEGECDCDTCSEYSFGKHMLRNELRHVQRYYIV
ncbi:unnamed protein product [Pieris macdunnoughi]|uniref:Uncharacterized protein n=1 Tax=Pieris macdunnoughi TaxID=345717 RepID=A0A821L2N7_9NEOP|nr:unnamed protein product [Pieris macdunnoughi]